MDDEPRVFVSLSGASVECRFEKFMEDGKQMLTDNRAQETENDAVRIEAILLH